jgi:hypothetical protein
MRSIRRGKIDFISQLAFLKGNLMGFPTSLPGQAANQAAAFVLGRDTDKGRVALAAYDLLGYGLFQAFGDVKYMMASAPTGPPPSAPPDVQNLLSQLQQMPPPVPGQAQISIPPWMEPLLAQAAQYLIQMLFQRLFPTPTPNPNPMPTIGSAGS